MDIIKCKQVVYFANVTNASHIYLFWYTLKVFRYSKIIYLFQKYQKEDLLFTYFKVYNISGYIILYCI